MPNALAIGGRAVAGPSGEAATGSETCGCCVNQPGPCCDSGPIPPVHKCWPSHADSDRQACIFGFRLEETLVRNEYFVETVTVPQPDCVPCPRNFTITRRFHRIIEQTGPAYQRLMHDEFQLEAGICGILVYVPVREIVESSNPVNADPCVLFTIVNERTEITYCQPVLIFCWDFNEENSCASADALWRNFHEAGVDGATPPVTFLNDSHVTRVKTENRCEFVGQRIFRDSSPGLRVHSSVPALCHGPLGDVRGSVAADIYSPIPYNSVHITNLQYTVNLGWDPNCDGTEGPMVCGAVEGDCNSRIIPVPYIMGEPCDGFQGGLPPIALMPRANVTACDTLDVGGWCYTFRPLGPLVTVVPPNAIISTQVADGTHASACCECLGAPLCPSTDISQNRPPCWINAVRSPFGGGEFIRSEAFVKGKCCCRPGDIFKLEESNSTLEYGWNGNEFEGFQELLLGATAAPFPSLPSMLTGIRRDYTGPVQYAYSERIGRNNQPNAGGWSSVEADPPIACEWRGGYTGNGVLQISWENPIANSIMYLRGSGFPILCPNDPMVDVNGRTDAGGGSYVEINRFNVVATCDSFSFQAEYMVRRADGTPIERLRGSFRWSITHEVVPTGSPCAGGCVPPPVLGTGPGGGLVGNPPPPRSSGGCGGCGGGGF